MNRDERLRGPKAVVIILLADLIGAALLLAMVVKWVW